MDLPWLAGDWKIDETPLDGVQFDRSAFDLLGAELGSLWEQHAHVTL